MSTTGAQRRYNPLTGRHILVSPGRLSRPWQGQQEPADEPEPPHHEPGCYLCPGNTRTGGAVNPNYSAPFAFDNDFPALCGEPADATDSTDPLFRSGPARGRNRVLCYSPDHGATLADMPVRDVRAVVDAWCAETESLSSDFAHVQIFENKGAMMGASSPHPHGQVWATDHVPDEVTIEDERQRDWHEESGRPLLLELAEREAGGERVVVENEDWLAIVPFWATWPFETLVLPRAAAARLQDLAPAARESLAVLIGALAIRYDNLFRTRFPYSMGWHGAPGREAAPWWQLHAHFYPPLLRSATVRKFMVGFELLAEAQRDLTPEQAAAQLRDAGAILYRPGR